jgi:transposase-like protein
MALEEAKVQMNLIDVTQQFKCDDDCLAYMESMRWPDGIRCPVCGCDKISKITRKPGSKNKRTRIYQCLEETCKQQFSATSGTIFNDSHLSLTKWFMALALIVDAKKSISANQLKEHLGIGSYRTAWYMAHRIRKAMENDWTEKMTGVVEMDETWVGGRYHGPEGRGRSHANKEIVFGMKQRSGELRMFHIDRANSETLAKYIRRNVSKDVELVMTDDYSVYPKAFIKSRIHGIKHKTVNHSKGIYVEGNVTTNGIESAFGLFKRGVIGSFHKISIKHLHRYLSEFETRFNVRKADDRFNPTLQAMLGIEPMPYAELTAGD